jgi:hypothetical protein
MLQASNLCKVEPQCTTHALYANARRYAILNRDIISKTEKQTDSALADATYEPDTHPNLS